jgi:phage-related tail protein
MNVTAEFIEKILDENRSYGRHNKELAKILYDKISEISEIKDEVNKMKKAFLEMESRYQEESKVLNDKLIKIREKCPHSIKHRVYDPSGGSDSYDYCLVCGKDL